ETIAEIAAEKAGIIKPGVPVIAGRQLPQAQQVLAATAARQQAELLSADVDFSWGGSHENFQVSGSDYSLDGLTCPLNGTHQLDNFAHAISAAKKLESLGWPVADKAIAQAGQSACWPGRLEWWGDDRSLLFDVCHNRAGVTAMVDYLQAEGIASARFVVGLSGERDAEEVLTPLSSLNAQIYAVPVPEVDSLAPARIADWARSVSLTSKVFDSAEAGFAAARAEGADGPVVVCGSLFLVSALRQRVSRLLNAD
ncbi:MAG: hypothetical protein OET90_08640, partial [Desulfuromonadales bacterium]|nr:hypothetical protein [Desulfuromonadales bacterium]